MAKSELLCKDQRPHIHRVNTAKVTSRPNLNVNSGTAIYSYFFPALLCVVCLHSYFNTRNSPKIDKNMFLLVALASENVTSCPQFIL